MGIIANRIENKSQKILFKEASKLGFAPVERDAVDLATEQAGLLHTLAISIAGGSTAPTRLKRTQLTVDGRPTLFLRPFADAIMHPGEIHTILSGAPREPVALTWDRHWIGDAERLSQDAELAAALKKFSWRLQTHVTFHLDWALQIRPIGHGKSQLVMKSGSYAGLFSITYGLARFRVIAAAAERALAGGDGAAQPFLLPCFGDLALDSLRVA